MVEPVFAKIGYIDIGPAIVIVIADHNAKAPSLVGHSGFVSYVGESSVVIVVEQHGPRRGLCALQRGKRRPVQQINVEPSIIVIVEESHSRARRLQDGAFVESTGTMVKFIQASVTGDI